ncbi:major facilitator superfamily domain-containing protein [Hygrophoropsis aurantiaca]|uniref:Major facilitator superfamily domain-containing protein n=1 Tax=Hygrophoropsis aurantiaca TaxID=72124 RepID=A0ACB7ZSS3_9AGAM|nr:major facilitator superfamily domain-containing protein [Hygrophoropsis aurantiaca]
MSGCAAEIFGRRAAFVCALVAFALGSALCGSATNMTWMIAARTVQGVGGGAILSLASIVISDMVSLAERGTYNGFIGL